MTVWTAAHPLGPWTQQNATVAPVPPAIVGDVACVTGSTDSGSGRRAAVPQGVPPAAPLAASAGAAAADGLASAAASPSAAGAAAASADVDPLGGTLSALPTPGQGCLYNAPTQTSVTRSQQNYVVRVDTPTGTEYVWTGDRWQQSWDGLKGHDPQFWAPLAFDAAGVVQEMAWVDAFTIDVV